MTILNREREKRHRLQGDDSSSEESRSQSRSGSRSGSCSRSRSNSRQRSKSRQRSRSRQRSKSRSKSPLLQKQVCSDQLYFFLHIHRFFLVIWGSYHVILITKNCIFITNDIANCDLCVKCNFYIFSLSNFQS